MRSRDTALVALYTAVAGVLSLAYARHAATGCTLMACSVDDGPSVRDVSFGGWTLYRDVGCNACTTDLTPILAGFRLLFVALSLAGVADYGRLDRREPPANG